MTGIGYTLSPTGATLNFDEGSGLKNGPLYGGKFGFSFGEYVEMSGLYLFNNDLKIDFTGLTAIGSSQPDADISLLKRTVGLKRYGSELKFNMGRGTLFPYIGIGAGLLSIEPENLDKSETIYLNGFAGLQYSMADRYTLLIQIENLRYRHNPFALFSETDLDDLGLSADAFEVETMNNVGLSAGISVYLGGRARGELTELDRAFQEQFADGMRGVALQVEPFGGQIDFDESLGFRKQQRMAGVQAGIDLGPFVGVRGFYWRGIEDGELTAFDDLQAYGGQVQMNFAPLRRNVAPLLTLGGGMMDVLSGYDGNGTVIPEDQPFLMAGLGASIPLGSAVQLQGGVRTIVMSTLDARRVSAPNDIQKSWMYFAGLSFGLGGRGRTGSRLVEERFEAVQAQAQGQQGRMEYEISQRERAVARAEARIDSLAKVLIAAQQGNEEALTAFLVEQEDLRRRSDSAAVVFSAQPVSTSEGTERTPTAPGAIQADGINWASLPIPKEGELYIRYGKPGGVLIESQTGISASSRRDSISATTTSQLSEGGMTTDLSIVEIQATIRRVLQEEMAKIGQLTTSGVPVSDAALLVQLEERLNARLLDMESRLEDRIVSKEETTPTPPIIVQTPQAQPQTVILEGDRDQVATIPSQGLRLNGLLPLTGFTMGHPWQVLLGLRADFRDPALKGWRILPEVYFGFGEDGKSYTLAANLARSFGARLVQDIVQPYGGLGVGFTSVKGLELVMTLLVGAEYTYGPGAIYGEYQTQDFFDGNRMVFGYRLNFR